MIVSLEFLIINVRKQVIKKIKMTLEEYKNYTNKIIVFIDREYWKK